MNALALLWRQFGQERWPALVLACSIALLSALASLTPRLMTDLDDRQLAQALGELSAGQGDVVGAWVDDSIREAGVEVDPWERHREAFATLHAVQPEPLRSALMAPQFLARVRATHVHTPPPETGYYETRLRPLVDPDLPTHAELVAGAWPTMPKVSDDARTARFDVAISELAADKMGWGPGQDIDGVLRVSGVFRPRDPRAKRALHVPLEYTIHEPVNADRGTALEIGAFVAPEYLGSPVPVAPLGMEGRTPLDMRVWFSTDPASIQGAGVDIGQLSSQLTSLLAQRYPVATAEGAGDLPETTRLTSELGSTLSRVAAQQATTRAILAVAATGPIAVGFALVALAARLVIQRRRQWLDLVNARGVSHRQLRRLAAVEGLLLGVPAAAIGHAAAGLAVPGPTVAWSWVIAGLVAVLAALLLALSMGVVGRHGRSDLSGSGGRGRVAAEALVGLGSVAAVWRVATRQAAVGAVDPLSAATPVLLALAACLLVLRLYPLPLRLLSAWLRGRAGLTGFLGAARALRDPAGGAIPIVTVLLGSTLAVMGATLLGTIATGTERATWEVNGSSIHVSGPRIYDQTMVSLQSLDGVAAVARIHDVGDNVALTVDGERVLVNLLLASGDLRGAYAVAPSGSPVPAAVFDQGAAPAVVVGERTGVAVGAATLQGVGDIRVVGRLRALPGVSTGERWALASADAWPGELPASALAMVAVEPGADVGALAQAVTDLLPNSRVSTASSEVAALRASATVAGLTAAFAWLAGATAILMALAIFGSQLLGGGERAHLAAILRTIGLRPRQLRGLTAWEVGPPVVVALLVGVALGVGLAALMLTALDFSAITGGINSPELHLHLPTLAAVVAGLTASLAVAVTVSAWQAGRVDLAQELRIGERR